ncbi:MAG: ABC transporter ATP-binding protein [Candidatus Auribacter fodinae]|jgi:subfamily B ATP-binding cassette protein MsbA|uniref:ABC transporter ATP-binding protein n=1 Tax=Candidatus Auribacter fodinae TaxID=2093366 RepID=A0A3A4R6F8_9BACT|nr:MAG: ABC transporter ATP-binding protein [Candidatus Auribacter fodinae]
MNIFKRILAFGAPYKKYFFLAILFMVLNTVFEGVSIFSLVPLVDKVLTGQPIELTVSINLPILDKVNEILAQLSRLDRLLVFKYIAVFIFIMFIVKGVAYFFSHLFMEVLGQNIVKDIRCRIFDHVEHLSIDFYTQERTGNLMSRVTSDVQMILEIVSGRFASTLIEFPKLFVYSFIIIIVDWKLVVAMALVPFIVAPIIMIGKKLRSLSRRTQRRLADLNSILFEVLTGIKIVQAFSMEQAELKRFVKSNERYYKIRIKMIVLDTLLNPLTEITGILICIIIMFFRIQKIINGDLSVGTFTLQVAAIVALLKPLKMIGKINSLLQRALGAAERIFEILDTKPSVVEAANPLELPVINKELVFDRVSFSYDTENGEATVLNDVSFTIKKGEIAAFVGPSGAGKTTILNLVARFYDPVKGRIMIDGVDLKNVSLASLRGQLGIVTQDTILFNESIHDNIAYGRENMSLKDVQKAAQMANAHDFIESMPEKYDTVIGEKGIKLSGGQKQRLAIARAILKNPAILILDEATSALDTESEKLVQGALDRLMEQRTVLVVAHRLSTIMHASKIFVLDNGKIQACGTHDELLKSNELYKRLYKMQFEMSGSVKR